MGTKGATVISGAIDTGVLEVVVVLEDTAPLLVSVLEAVIVPLFVPVFPISVPVEAVPVPVFDFVSVFFVPVEAVPVDVAVAVPVEAVPVCVLGKRA